jgi:hypothetical protein
MIIELRGLTGLDARSLANEQAIADNAVEDWVLKGAITNVLDPGPYTLAAALPDWNEMLIGDRLSALIAVRVTTYPGKEYPIRLQCPRRPFCRNKFEWEIDFPAFLAERTQRLKDEDAVIFKAGNRFPGVVPSMNIPFVFKLKTGADAKKTMAQMELKKSGPKKMQESINPMVESLTASILDFNGITKRKAIFEALEALPLGALDALLPLIQDHDCGVETDLEIDCPKCGHEIRVALPFDRAFFLPYSAKAQQDRRAPKNEDDEADEATAS